MLRSPALRPRLLALVLAAGVCLAGPVARATETSLADALTGDAKSAYDAAKLLYDDHDYAGAATKFRAALDASHDARLLWNVATCEKELRHYARAAALVERFRKEASSLVSEEFLAQADATLHALRDFYSPVRLRVEPSGTHLFVDGEDVGRSPLRQPLLLDMGKHVVRAEHEGYEPGEEHVEVAGKKEVAVQIALKLLPFGARLAIVSPEGDSVAVDDVVVGSGRWEGPLSSGTHEIRVTAPGKKPYVSSIEVALGERRTLEVTLEDERKGPLVWPWLVGGAAVLVAGGVVGGYLALKPHDQQQPFPTARLGTVYISGTGIGP